MIRIAVRSILAGFVGASPAAAGPMAATRTFSAWTASCNNLGACVVTGAAGDGDLIYLRLARDAGAQAAPSAKIVLAVPDGGKGPFPSFGLSAVDGTRKIALPTVPAKAAADDPTYVSGEIGDSLTLIAAIRDAVSLEVAIGGETGSLDLKGFTAALRFIDDRQGRVGGPTALVAKGMTPAGQVPAPPVPPVVVPARPGSAAVLDRPAVTPALLALAASTCEADVVKAHEDLKAWRLAPDRVLVSVPCQNGAYNFQAALYLTDAKGKPVEPLALPQPAGLPSDNPANVLTNGDFAPDTMTLSSFSKGRGIGDCGTSVSWVWTGKTFTLLEAAALDHCPGTFQQDWPNLYTAVRR